VGGGGHERESGALCYKLLVGGMAAWGGGSITCQVFFVYETCKKLARFGDPHHVLMRICICTHTHIYMIYYYVHIISVYSHAHTNGSCIFSFIHIPIHTHTR